MTWYGNKSVKQLMEECGFVQQGRLQKAVDQIKNSQPVVMPHKEMSFRDIQESKIKLNSK